MTAKNPGRTGRPWRRARGRVLRSETHCWICGNVVDMNLKKPDPLSPSIDHVEALALGGSPLKRGNLRLAHLGCNSSRQTGRLSETLKTSRRW